MSIFSISNPCKLRVSRSLGSCEDLVTVVTRTLFCLLRHSLVCGSQPANQPPFFGFSGWAKGRRTTGPPYGWTVLGSPLALFTCTVEDHCGRITWGSQNGGMGRMQLWWLGMRRDGHLRLRNSGEPDLRRGVGEDKGGFAGHDESLSRGPALS